MKKVTGRLCPTCAHDYGSARDFEVAEVPVVATSELTSLLEAVKALPAQFPKPPELPPALAETLEKVSQAGQHMESVAQNWEQQRAEEAQAEASAHLPAPTSELIEHWQNCSDCRPAWQKIWDGIAAEARKGHTPNGEVKEAIKEVLAQGRKGT